MKKTIKTEIVVNGRTIPVVRKGAAKPSTPTAFFKPAVLPMETPPAFIAAAAMAPIMRIPHDSVPSRVHAFFGKR